MAELVSKQQLVDFFKSLPSRGKSSVREGFFQIQQLGANFYPQITSAGEQALSGAAPENADVASDWSISETIADLVMSAATMTLYGCGRYDGELTPSELSDALTEAGLLDEERIDPVKLEPFFVLALAKQAELRADIEKQENVRSVLPNLMRFDLNVDVRVKFLKNEATEFLPVVIGHMDTDAEGQLIWFQVTREQLVRMQEDIKNALTQIEAVEAKLAIIRS